MKMLADKFAKFRSDEEGAVTVDWVVLTAGIVGLAFPLILTVTGGAVSITENVSVAMGSVSICADAVTC